MGAVHAVHPRSCHCLGHDLAAGHLEEVHPAARVPHLQRADPLGQEGIAGEPVPDHMEPHYRGSGMRKTLRYTVAEEGRDKGKTYLLTEMSASQAEMWAARAFLAMANNGIEIPAQLPDT